MAKVIVGGRTLDSMSGNGYATLARFNADGTLDTSFGTSGKVINPFSGTDDEIVCLAIDSTGRILAGGSHWTGSSRVDAVARFSADGVLDAAFGTAGVTTGNFTASGTTEIFSIAIQADDKILVGTDDNAVGRFNTDGTLDAGFATAGILAPAITDGAADFVPITEVYALAVLGSGKILYGGLAAFHKFEYNGGAGAVPGAAIGRLNADGTRDTSFGAASAFDSVNYGIAVDFFGTLALTDNARFGSALLGMEVDGSGKIVMSGWRTYHDGAGNKQEDVVARFTSAGVLDWYTANSYGGHNDEGQAVTIQQDGNIVTSGDATGGLGEAARFTPAAGALDGTFATAGVSSDLFSGGGSDIGYNVRVQSSGEIWVVGQRGSDDVVIILDSAGAVVATITATFGGLSDRFFAIALVGAEVVLKPAAITGLVIDGSGNLVVSGWKSDGSAFSDVAARFTPTGPRDWMTKGSYGGSKAFAVDLDLGGGIFTTGASEGEATIARFSSSGTLSGTFGTAGLFGDFFTGHDDTGYALKVYPSGDLVMAGTKATSDDAIGRFDVCTDTPLGMIIGTFGGTGDSFYSLCLGPVCDCCPTPTFCGVLTVCCPDNSVPKKLYASWTHTGGAPSDIEFPSSIELDFVDGSSPPCWKSACYSNPIGTAWAWLWFSCQKGGDWWITSVEPNVVGNGDYRFDTSAVSLRENGGSCDPFVWDFTTTGGLQVLAQPHSSCAHYDEEGGGLGDDDIDQGLFAIVVTT